ncbi:uncharacterized protein LOC122278674 isoform X2 [Carya illinoinensis]|nr:uncharacterized protein LOC122278674 isoform X2 [Carya illinoinensis]
MCQRTNPTAVDRTHKKDFELWFKTRVIGQRNLNPLDVSADLYALACGPESWVASYAGCIISGKRFHTKRREVRRRTQNSGVFVTGDNQSNNVDFYGVIHDILEIHYMGWRRVYLFRCEWFDVGDRRRGVRVDDHLVSVNMDRTWYKDEPFVLACQASQCFYIKDVRVKGNWHVVQKFTNRNVYDIPPIEMVAEEKDVNASSDADAYQENESSHHYTPVQGHDVLVPTPLSRNDIEPRRVDAREAGCIDNARLEDFINDAELGSTSSDATGDEEGSEEHGFTTESE